MCFKNESKPTYIGSKIYLEQECKGSECDIELPRNSCSKKHGKTTQKVGIFHTHPGNVKRISSSDFKYIQESPKDKVMCIWTNTKGNLGNVNIECIVPKDKEKDVLVDKLLELEFEEGLGLISKDELDKFNKKLKLSERIKKYYKVFKPTEML